MGDVKPACECHLEYQAFLIPAAGVRTKGIRAVAVLTVLVIAIERKIVLTLDIDAAIILGNFNRRSAGNFFGKTREPVNCIHIDTATATKGDTNITSSLGTGETAPDIRYIKTELSIEVIAE